MPLKLSLKPGEKFAVNGAVITNGDRRSSLVIQNQASILRERDILQADAANTPARRIYFPVMMLYLDESGRDNYYSEFSSRMSEFMDAITTADVLKLCVAISSEILGGKYYAALRLCSRLIEIEQEILGYEPERLSAHA